MTSHEPARWAPQQPHVNHGLCEISPIPAYIAKLLLPQVAAGAERHANYTSFRDARRHLRFYNLLPPDPSSSVLKRFGSIAGMSCLSVAMERLTAAQSTGNAETATDMAYEIANPVPGPKAAGPAGPQHAVGPAAGPTVCREGLTARYEMDAGPVGQSAAGSAMGPAFFISRRADHYRDLPQGLVR